VPLKAGETTILRLLQGSKVFLIPNFQRRYSWRAKEWELLWGDLVRELEVNHGDSQELEGHFLGSIVLHPAAGAASVLMQHLVIDGQQRLTTILILLAALRDIRAEIDTAWDPKEYDTKYLTNPYDPDHPNRLVPTELDRQAYVNTMRLGQPTDGIGQGYTFFQKKIRDLLRSEAVSLEELGNTLLLHMLVVEINTGPGDSVNNIFNTLNSKGRPLTAADLVRNELLLHVGEGQSRLAYERYWTPMESSLVVEKPNGFDDREFVTFLWSREVAFDPKATRQDVFPTFERRLRRSLDALPGPERRVKALAIFTEIYDDHHLFLLLRNPLDDGLNGPDITEELRHALDRLRRWGSEPSTPLALWLLREAVSGSIAETEAVESINVLLGYLGRRALAGVPTNLLNRILTPIAFRLRNRETPVVDALRGLLSAKGSYWPPNSEVLGAVVNQPIYVSAKRQVRFLLGEAERLLSDVDLVDTSDLEVTHVMPETLSSQWEDEILAGGTDLDDARALLHTLGNLTLTGRNQQLGNEVFPEQRAGFEASPFHLNRQLATAKAFLPQDIEERSVLLARLLLTGFPGPSVRQDVQAEKEESGATAGGRIETALQAMAEGEWTTEADLVEFLGVDSTDLRALVNELSAVVARLIRDDNGQIPEWFSTDLRSAVDAQSGPSDPRSRVPSSRLGELVRDVEQAIDETDFDDTAAQ
jgi:hypothetical protein